MAGCLMTLKTHQRMSIRSFTLLLPKVCYLTVHDAYDSAVSLATWLFPPGRTELAWNGQDDSTESIRRSNLYRRLNRFVPT